MSTFDWTDYKRLQFCTRLKQHQMAVFFFGLSEHACVTNHEIEWENSKIITTNPRYHQRRCLEA